jgi:hypothetical protein
LLTLEGDHVPVIPFVDVDGKVGTTLPAQMTSELPKLNAGTELGVTVTSNEVELAHCPADGVKIYVPEF